MAKKRRLTTRSNQARASAGRKRQQEVGPDLSKDKKRNTVNRGRAALVTDAVRLKQSVDPKHVGVALLSGAVVSLAYYPSDSVAVEQGDALWFALLAILIAMVAWAGWFWNRSGQSVPEKSVPEKTVPEKTVPEKTVPEKSGAGEFQYHYDSHAARSWEESKRLPQRLSVKVLDWGPWLLAGWMMCAAFATCPPGNLRMATNEGWLWLSAAAIFSASRLLTTRLGTRRSLLALLAVCAVGLSVHGLHQYFVTLPANRLLYQQDPDAVVALAGINAPPGSSERMVFANRLMDGGPTASFALANSLAAVLLFGVVLSVGVLRYQFRGLGRFGIVVWSLVVLLCATCLLAARSRSATLAMVVAVGLLWLSSGQLSRFRSRNLMAGLGVLLALAAGGTLFLGFFGNREWFEQAPASLAFRFQYWRASWQMALEYPLFGVGPGNFQSLYERYRELSTTEQIAEPHNLFVETLASGGFIALGLLIGMIVAGGGICLRRTRRADLMEVEMEGSDQLDSSGDRWVVFGGAFAFVLVWVVGIASLRLPDMDASIWVVPAVLVTGVVIWPFMSGLKSREIDSIILSGCVGVGIHLMVAGGWTVPGVAVLLWIGVGTLTRETVDWSQVEVSENNLSGFGWRHAKTCAVMTVMLGLIAGVGLARYSLEPVETRKTLSANATRLMQQGRMQEARSELSAAAAADPWSPQAMLWLANLEQLTLAARGDSAEVRQSWDAALGEALERAGEDPAAYRLVAEQRIHLYQLYGQTADLKAATDIFEQVAAWSPADEWVMAQMSVLEAARGRKAKARQYADKARALSVLGGNIERALSRQLIFLPLEVGPAAQSEPVRRPADQLLEQGRPAI